MYVYVKCSTSENNTLDHVYSNIKNAYRAVPLPQLGQSDHLSLPSGVKQSPKIIKSWPKGGLAQLQDCFA